MSPSLVLACCVLVATATAFRLRTHEKAATDLRDRGRPAAVGNSGADARKPKREVGMRTYKLTELHSPDGVLVWYPKKPGSYPFVSYAHGLGDGGEGLEYQVNGICEALAAEGFIVAAHQSCSYGCYADNYYMANAEANIDRLTSWMSTYFTNTRFGDYPGFKYYYREQTKVIDWAKTTLQHDIEAGIKADFTHGVGVAGHSMGGQATGYSASSEGHPDVSAAVLMHPFSASPMTPDKAFLILASDYDKTAPFKMSQDIYNAGTAAEKALVNIPNMYHEAVRARPDKYAPLVAAWLSIHLKNSSRSSSDAIKVLDDYWKENGDNVYKEGW